MGKIGTHRQSQATCIRWSLHAKGIGFLCFMGVS